MPRPPHLSRRQPFATYAPRRVENSPAQQFRDTLASTVERQQGQQAEVEREKHRINRALDDEQEQQAKQAQEAEKAAFNAEKDAREAKYRKDKRPTYLDSRGMIQTDVSDEEWERQKAGKAAAAETEKKLAVARRGAAAATEAIAATDRAMTLKGRELRAEAAKLKREAKEAEDLGAPDYEEKATKAKEKALEAEKQTFTELEWEKRGKPQNEAVVKTEKLQLDAAKAGVKEMKAGNIPATTDLLARPAPLPAGRDLDTSNERTVIPGTPAVQPHQTLGELKRTEEMPAPSVDYDPYREGPDTQPSPVEAFNQRAADFQASVQTHQAAVQAIDAPVVAMEAELQAKHGQPATLPQPDGKFILNPAIPPEDRQKLNAAIIEANIQKQAFLGAETQLNEEQVSIQAEAQELERQRVAAEAEEDAAIERMGNRFGMEPFMGRVRDLTKAYRAVRDRVSKAAEGQAGMGKAAQVAAFEEYRKHRDAALQEGRVNRAEILKELEKTETFYQKRLGEISQNDDQGPERFEDLEVLESGDAADVAAFAEKYGIPVEKAKGLREDAAKLARTWETPLGKDPDQTRILSEGDIVVNPDLWVDPEAYEKAVRESGGTKENKEQALALLPSLRKDAATRLLNSMAGSPELAAMVNALPGKTDEEKALALVKQRKDSPIWSAVEAAWRRTQGASVSTVQGGITGMIAALTGNRWATESMLAYQDEAAAYESAAGALAPKNFALNFLTKIPAGAVSVVPALAGGASAKVGARLLNLGNAGTKIATAAGSALTAGGQSTAGTYGQAMDMILTRNGGDFDAARAEALIPSLTSGLITAVATAVGGGGVESVLADATKRAAIKQTLWQTIRGLGVTATRESVEELLEEATDQLGQAINEKLTFNPDKPVREIVAEVIEAGALGGVLGGVMGGAKAYDDARGAPEREAIQKAADMAASDEELASYVAPGGVGGNDEISFVERARVVRDLAQGKPLSDLNEQERKLIGFKTDNNGELKPITGKDAPPPAIKIIKGQPVILDSQLAVMEQYLPKTASTVSMGEVEAEKRILNPKATQPKAKNEPTDSGQPANVPADGKPTTGATGAPKVSPGTDETGSGGKGGAGSAEAFAVTPDVAKLRELGKASGYSGVEGDMERAIDRIEKGNIKGARIILERHRNSPIADVKAYVGQILGDATPTKASTQNVPRGTSVEQGQAWTAKTDKGTILTIPAGSANTAAEAELALAAQVPTGEVIDPASITAPAPIKTGKVSGGKTGSPKDRVMAAAKPIVKAEKDTKKAGGLATRAKLLAEAVEREAGKFAGIVFEPVPDSSGFSIRSDGSLAVDVELALRHLEGKSMADVRRFITRVIREEFQHRISIELERDNKDFGDKLQAWYDSLPAEIKQQAEATYTAQSGQKKFRSPFEARHETFRQFLERKNLTEAALAPKARKDLRELILAFVKALRAYYKGAAPQVRALLDELIAQAEAKAAELQGLETKTASTIPAVQTGQTANPDTAKDAALEYLKWLREERGKPLNLDTIMSGIHDGFTFHVGTTGKEKGMIYVEKPGLGRVGLRLKDLVPIVERDHMAAEAEVLPPKQDHFVIEARALSPEGVDTNFEVSVNRNRIKLFVLGEDGKRTGLYHQIILPSNLGEIPTPEAMQRFFEQGLRVTYTQDGQTTLERTDKAKVQPPEALPAPTVDAAANEADTAATDAQKEAENHKVGRVTLLGHEISIETPAGAKRRPEWPALKDHYGRILGTTGADSTPEKHQHVDAFVREGTPSDWTGPVFVINQNSKDGKFDEHKVVFGAKDASQAKATYMRNYAKGWRGFAGVFEMTPDQFRSWVTSDATSKAAVNPANPKANATADKLDALATKTSDPKLAERYRRKAAALRAGQGQDLATKDAPEAPAASGQPAGPPPVAAPVSGSGSVSAETRYVASKGKYESVPPIPFYTATTEAYAKNFGENVTQVKVSPRSTLDLTDIAADADDGGQLLRKALESKGIDTKGADIFSDDELAQALNRNLKTLSDRIAAAGYDSVKLNEYVHNGGSDVSLLIVSDSALSGKLTHYPVSPEPSGKPEPWPRVMSDAMLDRLQATGNLPDGYVSIPNPKQVGTKDQWLVGPPDDPVIRAYRIKHGLEEKPEPQAAPPSGESSAPKSKVEENREKAAKKRTPRVATPRAKTPREVAMRSREFKERIKDDAISHLREHGRIQPPTTEQVRDFRGRITGRKLGEKGGEWDFWINWLDGSDAETVARRKAFAELVFAEGGLSMGDAEGYMRDYLKGKPLGEALETAFAERERILDEMLKDDAHMSAAEQQRTEFDRHTAAGPQSVTSWDVHEGDVLMVDGQPVKVIGFDPDTGDAILQDGTRFGRQTLPTGETIYVERIEQASNTVAPEPPPLALEQQTPEQVDAEREKAKRLKELQDRQNAPLKGTLKAGDTVPDMFDTTAGETPLFSQPETKPTPKAEPAPKFETKLKDQARDAFKGLFSPPAGLSSPSVGAQQSLPPDKLPAFINLASALVQAGVKTPQALAAFLDETFPGGQARPYSQALWNAVGMVDLSLMGSHDWNSLYIEQSRPDDVPPSDDVSPGSDVERGGKKPTSRNQRGKGGVPTQPGTTRQDGDDLDATGTGSGDTGTGDAVPADVPPALGGNASTPKLDQPEPADDGSPSRDPEPAGSGDLDANGVAPDGRGKDAPAISLVLPGQPGTVGTGSTSGLEAAIRASAPSLNDDQVGDVVFAEKRLIQDGKPGVLFTNGTGTGKTFTGLGVVKRMLDAGAQDILILAPSDKVVNDWIATAKRWFNIQDVIQLPDIVTNGSGNRVVVTTYANFGQNNSLVDRPWAAVVTDEAHYLGQNEGGDKTLASMTLDALTWHPRFAVNARTNMIMADEIAEKRALDEAIRANNRIMNNPDTMDVSVAAYSKENEAMERKSSALNNKIEAERQRQRDQLARTSERDRPKTVMLSATPFAHHFSLDYAEGYLFEHGPEPQSRGYNTPSARSQFYISNFGYRMRYGKLTKPENAVSLGILERMFSQKLMKSGAMSGRQLQVPQDYGRHFVITESALGNMIDRVLDVIQSTPRFQVLNSVVGIGDYLARRYLLEALKAKESVARIKEHLALGRKVVVFHDYKKGGSTNPLSIATVSPQAKGRYTEDGGKSWIEVPIHDVYAELRATIEGFDDAVRELDGLRSPLDLLQDEFPKMGVFNGDIGKAIRRKTVDKFIASGSGMDVILVQRASGKEGISLHDTDKLHQRVFIDIGIPSRPTDAIQGEGRIYRIGVQSNAVIEYLTTGTNFERWTFAQTIAQRASTAENLAMGERARSLLQSFATGYNDAEPMRPSLEQGTGGKEKDRAAASADPFAVAVALYYTNQKKTSRTKAAEGIDYFPTPEPLGLKMVEWSGVRPGEKILEPSGGHGSIARFFPDATNRHAVEPSNELAGKLALNATDTQIHQMRFEDYNIGNKFDTITMNPPFGHGGKTAIEHLMKAAKHLRNGGRIVALIPEGPSMDARLQKWLYEGDSTEKPATAIAKSGSGPIYIGDRVRFAAFGDLTVIGKGWHTPDSGPYAKTGYETLKGEDGKEYPLMSVIHVQPGPRTVTVNSAKNLYMVAEFGLPNVVFERAGTSVKARIIILDRHDDPKDVPNGRSRRDFSGDTIKEFFDQIKDATVPPRNAPSKPEPAPALTEEAPASPASALLTGRDAVLPSVSKPNTFAPAQGHHAKENRPTFVAKVMIRLDATEFAKAREKATKHGGYWSSFKGTGAIPGFQFPTVEKRDAFLAEYTGPQGQSLSSPSAGFITPAMDEAYLDAVKRGYMDSARAMVEQAAKGAGYRVGPVYHKSPSNFKVFDTEESEGAHFGSEEQANNLRMRGNDKARAFFLRINKPLRLPDLGVWSSFNNVHAHLSREGIITNKESDDLWTAWQSGDKAGWKALKDTLRAKGYDGIVYQNEVEGEGDSYLAFDANDIKSAETVTHSGGKVVKLSARFNPESPSILYSPAFDDAPRQGAVELNPDSVVRDNVRDLLKSKFGIVVEDDMPGEGLASVTDRKGNVIEDVTKLPREAELLVGMLEATNLEYDGDSRQYLKFLMGEYAGLPGASKDLVLNSAAPGDESDAGAIEAMHEALSEQLPSDEDMANLREFHDGELPGEFTIGDPEIANPGTGEQDRKAFDVAREIYSTTLQTKQQFDDWDRAGREMATQDPEGVRRAVLGAYNEGRGLSQVETRAAVHLNRDMMSAALTSGNEKQLRDATAFAVAYYGTGTEVARAMRARADTTKTREERLAEFLTEAITNPQKIEQKIKLATLPRAADKDRTIARLTREIEAAREAGNAAQVKARAQERETERRKQTREDMALQIAKQQRDEIAKALKKEGLSIEDLLDGRVQYRLKFGRLVMDAMGKKDPAREKAIDLMVHGWPTRDIAKATKMSEADVAALREELRARPPALREALAKAIQRGMDATQIVGNMLSSPAVAKSWKDALAEADSILDKIDRIIPSAADADSGRWKKVRRVRPEDKSAEADMVRAISAMTTGPRPKVDPREVQTLIRLHRTKKGVKDFVKKAIGYGVDPETARKADELIEAERARKVRPVTEVDLDVEYLPFDHFDPKTTYRVMRRVDSVTKRWYDMLRELWINAILSGLQTQVVNLVGNAAVSLYELIVERAFESAIGSLGGRKANAQSFGEYRYLLKGILPGIVEGAQMAAAAWSTEQETFGKKYLTEDEDDDGDIDRHGPTGSIPGKVGRVVRIPGRSLRAADNFFKTVIARIEVGAMAYRVGRSKGLKDDALSEFINSEVGRPGSLSWVAAAREAERRTFTDNNALVNVTEHVLRLKGVRGFFEGKALAAAKKGDMNMARAHVGASKIAGFTAAVLSFIFPFVRTPVNIFRMGLKKSPVGSLSLIYNIASGLNAAARGEGFVSKYPAAVLTKNLTEQALAWTAFTLLYAMAEGDDDDDKKKWLLVGGRPYSQETGTGDADSAKRQYGGTYMLVRRNESGVIDMRVPFGRVEPFATALGGMIDAMSMMKRHWRNRKEGESGKAASAVAQGVARNLLGQAEDKTFLRGFSNVMRAVGDIRTDGGRGEATKFLTDIAAGFVPNLGKQAVRNLDDYERNYKQSEWSHSFWPDGKAANQMVDIFGEDVTKSGPKWLRVLWPTPLNIPHEGNPTDELLQSWNVRHPVNVKGDENARESRYFPERPDRGAYQIKTGPGKNDKRTMTLPEMRAFDKTAGQRFRTSQQYLTPPAASRGEFRDVLRLQKNLSNARTGAKASVTVAAKRNPAPAVPRRLPFSEFLEKMKK